MAFTLEDANAALAALHGKPNSECPELLRDLLNGMDKGTHPGGKGSGSKASVPIWESLAPTDLVRTVRDSINLGLPFR